MSEAMQELIDIGVQNGREEGFAQGREEGEKAGRLRGLEEGEIIGESRGEKRGEKKGEKKGLFQSIKTLIQSKTLELSQIAQIYQLPLSQIEELAREC